MPRTAMKLKMASPVRHSTSWYVSFLSAATPAQKLPITRFMTFSWSIMNLVFFAEGLPALRFAMLCHVIFAVKLTKNLLNKGVKATQKAPHHAASWKFWSFLRACEVFSSLSDPLNHPSWPRAALSVGSFLWTEGDEGASFSFSFFSSVLSSFLAGNTVFKLSLREMRAFLLSMMVVVFLTILTAASFSLDSAFFSGPAWPLAEGFPPLACLLAVVLPAVGFLPLP
mmetsp:Transcript_58042/g.142373  ORF Transcript_58042/g.142373 Transcript_58042/m.142373 type:complete len:226 (-) Transcript_58042:627-1304(-)